MNRLSHAAVFLFAAGFFGLAGLSSETFGQSVTIDDPLSNTSKPVGPGAAPLEIKFTITGTYHPTRASMEYVSGGVLHVLSTGIFSPDATFPPGSGHYKCSLFPGTPGVYPGCLFTVRAEHNSNTTLPPIEGYSTNVTVTKQ